ncbi:MAG: hypothetical protein BWY06_03262 [Candidatus Latescibacteria bacterium ADurb.Bin168]|nr:MAG: hypothetical protein BWY06_03262 [Candidatus Latescibacteria bacterium ADurb.Bin168]
MFVMAVVVAVPQSTSRAVSRPLPVMLLPIFVTPWAGNPISVAPVKSHVPIPTRLPEAVSTKCGNAAHAELLASQVPPTST